MSKSNYYVDNKLMLKELMSYRKEVKEAKLAGKEKPRIPEYVGKCFLLIAQNFSHKPNFNQYPCKEEMIGDAIENCVMYVDNFNPAITKNPFAYFSQIVYYAFLRRIEREKTALYVKYKSTETFGVLDEFDQLSDGEGNTRQFEMYDNISEFIERFEVAREKKRVKMKSKANLKKFMQDELDA